MVKKRSKALNWRFINSVLGPLPPTPRLARVEAGRFLVSAFARSERVNSYLTMALLRLRKRSLSLRIYLLMRLWYSLVVMSGSHPERPLIRFVNSPIVDRIILIAVSQSGDFK